MDAKAMLAERTAVIRAGHVETTGDSWQPDDWRERLHARFPTILRTAWGIECGPGWADLITAACEILSETETPPEVSDVKEKYGTLRLYMIGYEDLHYDIEDAALELSACICDRCGAPGELRPRGWMATLCDSHFEESGRR